MKNFKKYIKITLLISLLVNVSCEDYLKDELLSETSVDFIYNTPEGIDLAATGLYNLNRELYQLNGGSALESSGTPLVAQAKSDLVLPRASHIAFMARQVSWGVDQTKVGTVRLAALWQHYYRLVDRSNALITYADDVSFTDEKTKKRLIAEAKCFRANSYFTLYRLFNNIFVTTEPTTPENAFNRPEDKSSVEEIFKLLREDLTYAIDNLDWTTNEPGRWTQASARHLKAKVAMWENDLVEAANQTDKIIENGNYNLVSETKKVFLDDMNHEENLFSIQYKDNAIGGSGTNLMNFSLVPGYVDKKIPGVKYSIENGGRGNGSLLVNEYLQELLDEDPNDDRNNGNYFITAYTYNDAENLPAGKKVGDTIKVYFRNGNKSKNYYRTLNPSCIKFRQETADPEQSRHISTIMIYRLAETLLIGAEAHMNSNPTKALDYLNRVRERANAAKRNTPVDMQAIMDERARELGFEGQRFYFLKRIGKYVEQIKKYAGNDGSRNNNYNHARTAIKDHFVNFPIPIAELNLLGPNYPQNDGYPE